MSAEPLRMYRLTLYRDEGHIVIDFDCWAFNAQRAVAQADDAYPGWKIISLKEDATG